MDGKYISWIKFANSLRLRLAMRISLLLPIRLVLKYRK